MKETKSAKSSQPSAPRPNSPIPAREPSKPNLLVRYYRKMKLQRTYPLSVEWEFPSGESAEGKTLPAMVIRPTIPGSLVCPNELTLDTTENQTSAVFYVTPLTKGKVPPATVEAYPPKGKPIQISLPMRFVRQRLTKLLLILTIVLPALFLYFTKSLNEDLKGDVAYGRLHGRLREFFERRNVDIGKAGKDRNKSVEPATVNLTEGEMLELLISENMPEIPHVTENLGYGLGVGYQFVCTMSSSDPLAFYLGVILLMITFLSWVAHMSARGKRRSKSLVISAPAA